MKQAVQVGADKHFSGLKLGRALALERAARKWGGHARSQHECTHARTHERTHTRAQPPRTYARAGRHATKVSPERRGEHAPLLLPCSQKRRRPRQQDRHAQRPPLNAQRVPPRHGCLLLLLLLALGLEALLHSPARGAETPSRAKPATRWPLWRARRGHRARGSAMDSASAAPQCESACPSGWHKCCALRRVLGRWHCECSCLCLLRRPCCCLLLPPTRRGRRGGGTPDLHKA